MAAFFANAFEAIGGFFTQIFMALIDIRFSDVIDILIIAYIIYKAIGFFKETRAKILIKGLLLLLVVWILAQWLDLISLKWILVKFFDYAIIAVAIIFQPELQVDTISTRLEPLPFIEFSNALRIAFLALRMAGTDCTD